VKCVFTPDTIGIGEIRVYMIQNQKKKIIQKKIYSLQMHKGHFLYLDYCTNQS